MNYKNFNLKNLVNARDIVHRAWENKYTVVQININNLEWGQAALLAAEAQRAPLITGFSEGAIKYIGGTSTCSAMMAHLIKNLKITIPVAIQLDHGSSYEVCKNAIENGFTSVMFDGSSRNINENCEISQKVRKLATEHHVSVELEVGTVGKDEDSQTDEMDTSIEYAKLEDCQKIVKLAQPDYLAAALGSVHGHYNGKPKLNFEQMKLISERCKIPIVLHGTSGIPFEDIQKATICGNAKMNVNTEFQEVFFRRLQQYFAGEYKTVPKHYDPRKILRPGRDAIQTEMENYLKIAKSNNKY